MELKSQQTIMYLGAAAAIFYGLDKYLNSQKTKNKVVTFQEEPDQIITDTDMQEQMNAVDVNEYESDAPNLGWKQGTVLKNFRNPSHGPDFSIRSGMEQDASSSLSSSVGYDLIEARQVCPRSRQMAADRIMNKRHEIVDDMGLEDAVYGKTSMWDTGSNIFKSACTGERTGMFDKEYATMPKQ